MNIGDKIGHRIAQRKADGADHAPGKMTALQYAEIDAVSAGTDDCGGTFVKRTRQIPGGEGRPPYDQVVYDQCLPHFSMEMSSF